MALKDKNVPKGSDKAVSTELKVILEQHLQNGLLPCAQAFVLAKQQDMEPGDIGNAADALQMRLGHCQLGLFGYPGKQGWKASGVVEQAYPAALESAIKAATDADNHIFCKTAWELAKQYAVSRMLIGYVIDTLGIKIVNCQLGVF